MVGQIVGSYRIERELGLGGMGAVYLAKHTLLEKYAAVKMLRGKWSADQEAVDRFFTEAKATTAVTHSGIVDVYDFGYHSSGSAFLVMELLDGETLGDRIRREDKLPEADALNYGWQAARALAAAHVAEIIHRDLKPDNIFLSVDPAAVGGVRVKLLDFGIAKLQHPGAKRHTNPGEIVGTPLFMSPEHCVGGHVDGRSDVYSLACVLFYAISGRPPFCSEEFSELLRAHVSKEAPALLDVVDPRSVKPATSALLARCLSKKREERPSADEFAGSLHQLLGSGGPRELTVPPSDLLQPHEPAASIARAVTNDAADAINPHAPTTPAPLPALRLPPSEHFAAVNPARRWLWLAAAVLVLAIAAGGAVALLDSGSEPTTNKKATSTTTTIVPVPAEPSAAPSALTSAAPDAAPPDDAPDDAPDEAPDDAIGGADDSVSNDGPAKVAAGEAQAPKTGKHTARTRKKTSDGLEHESPAAGPGEKTGESPPPPENNRTRAFGDLIERRP